MHGMQKVRGSNPLSSTGFSGYSFDAIVTNIVTILGRVLVLCLVRVTEDVIHDGGAASDRGPDDVPVDLLGDVGRLEAVRSLMKLQMRFSGLPNASEDTSARR
jgi:hypothetical protein